MTGHIHAALMLQYAQDAMANETPWQMWQHKRRAEWRDCTGSPAWNSAAEYRRKPRTIRIGEFDVPEPLREAPAVGTEYFVPILQRSGMGDPIWDEDGSDKWWLAAGLVHLTREAAEQHARALLSFTQVQS